MTVMAATFMVDFTRKELLCVEGAYERYTWKCDCCGNRYTYDSRKEDNVKRIDSRISVCHTCINLSYEMLNKEGNEND